MVDRDRIPYGKAFTAVLWFLGLLFVALVPVLVAVFSSIHNSFAPVFESLPGGAPPTFYASFAIYAYLIVLAVMCCWSAALRSAGSPIACTATAATAMLLALWWPVGTLVFLWWWLGVRKRESELAPL